MNGIQGGNAYIQNTNSMVYSQGHYLRISGVNEHQLSNMKTHKMYNLHNDIKLLSHI